MTDEPNDQPALVPVRQQTVDFYGDRLPAGQLADGTILVPMRPLVEALGLDWPSQYQRLKRDPMLRVRQGVVIITTPGGEQRFLALPLKLLPGFLFGLNASRVKPELRARILRYQEDCYEVLWNAFKADILPTPSPVSDLTGAARALEIAEALYHLARQQLALEQAVYDLNAHAVRTDDRLSTTDERLSALELHLSAGATLSEAQAAELALAVKTVAAALTAQGTPNGYAVVYSELYRRYQVSSYKALPAAHYAAARAWLSTWYDELAGKAPARKGNPD